MSTRFKRIAIVTALALLPLALIVIMTFPRIATSAAIPNDAFPADKDIAFVTGADPSAPSPDGPQQIGLATGYAWNYSAKFVCGEQPIPQPGVLGEPPVKPGNYATDINIHNYNYKGIQIYKKVVVLVEQGNPIGREPQAQPPRGQPVIVTMGPDYAMMDDCNAIWKMIYPTAPPIPAVMPLMIGYLVILSRLDLDVDVVYTAQVPSRPTAVAGGGPVGISIDVERVLGKRVYVHP